MITGEWDVPFSLITPEGTLDFNELVLVNSEPLGYYMLDPARCSTGVARRVTRTNIAQAGGEIVHRKFKSGYVMELNMQLWETIGGGGEPACQGTLRKMIDHLMLHLNAIDNADGRVMWQPSAWPSGAAAPAERMLDPVRMLGPSGSGGGGFVSVVAEKDPGGPLTTLTFALLCPLHYAQDAPQTTTALGGSTPVAVNNTGNADYYPVFRIDGPTNNFQIVNYSNLDPQGNPKQIVYEGSALPGGASIAGGHYAEIVTFWNTVYLDGNLDNLKPGLDVLNTDFWTLVPGVNNIEIFGASGEMLWQPAYA